MKENKTAKCSELECQNKATRIMGGRNICQKHYVMYKEWLEDNRLKNERKND